MIKLYNTLGRNVTELKPLEAGKVKIYTCGPTVYDYQHIGNYSGYIYWDVLVRLLEVKGLSVERVINITDVGHLVSDSDEGEDKLEKGAKREGKTAREVADFYTEDFYKNAKKLGLVEPKHYAKATDYIKQQLEIVKALLSKGFAYQTKQAIYFDVTKLEDYGKLSGQKLEDKEVGVRDNVVTDSAKHHPQDFALWFFTIGRFADHEMHWDSPWGSGFPGWHLECSAIIHACLGEPIDIHAGGIDHIGTHHTNEIAQSETAFGKSLAKIWIHNNHMLVDERKISKSLQNGIRIDELEEKGFTPQDFRFFVMQSHYRSQSKFSWDSLSAAKANLKRLEAWADLVHQDTTEMNQESVERVRKGLEEALSDDLNTPKALAVLNSIDLSSKPSHEILEYIDSLLALGLSKREDISEQHKTLILERQSARHENNWQKSDEIRQQLDQFGIQLNDNAEKITWLRLR